MSKKKVLAPREIPRETANKNLLRSLMSDAASEGRFLSPFYSKNAAEYRHRAETLRALAAQIMSEQSKQHLLEAARHLDLLAKDKERHEAAPRILVLP